FVLAHHALTAKTGHLSGLRADGDLEGHVAIKGRDTDLLAPVGLADRDRDVEVEIVPFPLEVRMGDDVDLEEEVARRPAAHARRALTGDAKTAALAGPGRDPHLDALAVVPLLEGEHRALDRGDEVDRDRG